MAETTQKFNGERTACMSELCTFSELTCGRCIVDYTVIELKADIDNPIVGIHPTRVDNR